MQRNTRNICGLQLKIIFISFCLHLIHLFSGHNSQSLEHGNELVNTLQSSDRTFSIMRRERLVSHCHHLRTAAGLCHASAWTGNYTPIKFCRIRRNQSQCPRLKFLQDARAIVLEKISNFTLNKSRPAITRFLDSCV